MTLTELLEKAREYPQNADVVVPDEDGEPTVIKTVYFDGERVWLYDHAQPDYNAIAAES
ncbi:MAG: hypothetical protein IKU86_12375 [Thermoguttaceae bacterium]|nr:hypothetical protein [Thermoguttaceae bacterium]